jgi:LPXTG-motif cell wall-anchored protein
VLQGSVDQAIGYFFAKHYTHSLPMLERVTKKLPDRELLAMLEQAKKLKGTAADKSMAEDMGATTETASTGSSWSWLLPVVVLGVAALAAATLLLLRRRRDRVAGSADEWAPDPDDDLDLPLDEDDALGDPAPGQRGAALADVQPGRTPYAAPQQPRTSEPGTTVLDVGGTDQQRAGHYCPRCGVSLVAGDRFCFNCGTPAR